MQRAAAFVRGGRGRGRFRHPDAWVLMLALQLAQRINALENKPPVTLGVMALCAAVFYEDLLPLPPQLRPPSLARGCLSPAAVLHGQWSRLLWAGVLHADEMHLLYNLSSLLVKGVQLEPRLGSARFAVLLLELMLLTHGLVVAGTYGLAHFVREWRTLPASSCAVGISGAIFALKVVLQHNAPGTTQVLGFTLPTKHLAWAELLLASAFNPRASFVGHLCGILAGLLHVRCVAPALARAELAWRQAAAHQGSSSSSGGSGRRPRGGGSGGSGGQAGGAAGAPPSSSSAEAAAAAAQQRIQAAQQRGIPASRAQQQQQADGRASGGDAAPPLSAEDLRLRRLQRFGG